MESRLTESLRLALPDLRGKLRSCSLLSEITWFRVGGPAEVLFVPADEDDLIYFLSGISPDVPVSVIGLGSNLLVRDGGIAGVVIRLTKGFSKIEREFGYRIRVGAGAHNIKLARFAADSGIGGFSFLRGIPGSIGGALRMNCGSYGSEVKDILIEAQGVTRSGKSCVFSLAEMGLSYRHCDIPDDMIFVSALFQGYPAAPDVLAGEMEEMILQRNMSQPVRMRTGGSTFKNPLGYKAWELIDRAGCRGVKLGAAQVSELHCNFLINTGGATACEIEDLGEYIRNCVKDTESIELEWEIKRLGIPLGS